MCFQGSPALECPFFCDHFLPIQGDCVKGGRANWDLEYGPRLQAKCLLIPTIRHWSEFLLGKCPSTHCSKNERVPFCRYNNELAGKIWVTSKRSNRHLWFCGVIL